MHSPSGREISAWYDLVFSSEGFRAKTSFYRKVARYGRGRVLDLACGLGLLVGFISGVGCDISRVALQKARASRSANDFIQCDAHALPFRDETFDTVFSLGSFEHFEDQDLVLKEVYRVLQDGGLCIFTITNSKRFTSLARFFTKDLSQPIMKPLDPSSAGKKFSTAGFRVLSVKKVFQFDTYGPFQGRNITLLRAIHTVLPTSLSIEPLYVCEKVRRMKRERVL